MTSSKRLWSVSDMSEVICFQFAGPFRESFSGDGIRTSQEEPCVGGDDWNYVDFLGYYECVIQE